MMQDHCSKIVLRLRETTHVWSRRSFTAGKTGVTRVTLKRKTRETGLQTIGSTQQYNRQIARVVLFRYLGLKLTLRPSTPSLPL